MITADLTILSCEKGLLLTIISRPEKIKRKIAHGKQGLKKK